jgi:nucleotide-binding universal stress UspA family protein
VAYHKILVPLDGSEMAEKVLVYAKELAARLDLDVTLLYVCSKEEYQVLPMHRAYVDRVADLLKTQTEAVRLSIGDQQQSKAGQIMSRVTVGYPAEQILRYVDENEVDLILMATHGRSGIMRWVLGSVADKVLRASTVPVFLIRAGIPDDVAYDKWPKTTMLVPLDGSKLAESVLPHVEVLAKQRGLDSVEVSLLRVAEPPAIPADYPADMPLSWEEHLEQETAKRKTEGEHYLAGVEKQLKDAGLNVRAEVLVGNPVEEIIGHCSKNRSSIVVMATHGRSGLSRWAYGSVAEKTLLGTSCPILIVRPR